MPRSTRIAPPLTIILFAVKRRSPDAKEVKEKLLRLATDAIPDKKGSESSRITILSKPQNQLFEEGKICTTIPLIIIS